MCWVESTHGLGCVWLHVIRVDGLQYLQYCFPKLCENCVFHMLKIDIYVHTYIHIIFLMTTATVCNGSCVFTLEYVMAACVDGSVGSGLD
jgi:hypothetical protein